VIRKAAQRGAQDDEIKNNEMSRRVARMEERDNLENLGVDGAIMKIIFKIYDGRMDWIDLVQYVYEEMDLRVS
jgi:hypothetical protein